jgi:outer membrane lipoprotein SlyB
MRLRDALIFSALIAVALGGCATVPAGPSVLVLPGPGKTFEQFQTDDAVCRQWAAQRIGVSPQQAANENVAKGAVAGTAIGAGLGAALGSASGHLGAGAAVGAVGGALVGTAAGASAGQVYGYEAQRIYDNSYVQCMYAKGNEVPGRAVRTRRSVQLPPPPPDLSQPGTPEPRSAPPSPPGP